MTIPIANSPGMSTAPISAPRPVGQRGRGFSEVLGRSIQTHEDAGPMRPGEMLVQGLQGLEADRARLDRIIAQARAGRTFRPAELLALQAEVHRVGEEAALTQRLVDEGMGALRRLWSMQL